VDQGARRLKGMRMCASFVQIEGQAIQHLPSLTGRQLNKAWIPKLLSTLGLKKQSHNRGGFSYLGKCWLPGFEYLVLKESFYDGAKMSI
jgi:hypothetical protein